MQESTDEPFIDTEDLQFLAEEDVSSRDIPEASTEVRGTIASMDRNPLKVNPAELGSYVHELISICIGSGVSTINRKWIYTNDTRFYTWLQKRMPRRTDTHTVHPLWHRLQRLLAEHGIVLDLNLPVPEQRREKDGVQNVARALLRAKLSEWIPDTLKEIAPREYRYFSDKYNTSNGVRWSLLVRQLPEPLQALFVYPKCNDELFKHYPEEKNLYVRGRRLVIQRGLKSLLNEKRPVSFNVAWIEENSKGMWQRVSQFASIDDNFSWWSFIKELGDGWLEKFNPRFSFRDESTLDKTALAEYREQKATYLKRRISELQGRLHKLLETENPEAFSPTWIQTKNRSLFNEINRLMKSDDEVSWYDFVEEIGESWLVRFDFKCRNLKNYARKLVIIVKAQKVTKWSLQWLRDTQGVFLSCVYRQLRSDGMTGQWQNFLSILDPSLIDIYEDENSVKEAAKEQHKKNIIELAAQKLAHAVTANGLVTWTLEEIADIDPVAYRAVTRRDYTVLVGVRRCLPLLPDDILSKARSNVSVMKYVFLAERVRRAINGNAHRGWRIQDVDELLRAELGQLNGKMSVLLSFLPPELSFGFVPEGTINVSRARVANVLASGDDDPKKVHEILEKTGYLESGKVSIQLLISLRDEIRQGNKYAVTIAESILEDYLCKNRVHIPIKRGCLAEILFRLNEDDDLQMQIIRLAYGFGRERETISLDKPAKTDSDRSFGEQLGLN